MTSFANVNLGTAPSDGTGTPLRNAFSIINENFANITAIAGNANVVIFSSGNANVTATYYAGVESVAGRKGNVILTVNDVLGAAANGYVTSLSLAGNLYTDSKVAAVESNVYIAIADNLSTEIANTAANIASGLIVSGQLLAPVNANVVAANAKISTLQGQVSTITTDILDLYTNALAQGNSLSTLTVNLNQTNANVTAANLAITTLQGNAATQQNDIAGLRANITAANAAVIARDYATVNQLRANTLVSNTAIASVNANVTAANLVIASLVSGGTASELQIQLLDANVGIISGEIASLFLYTANTAANVYNLQTNVTAVSDLATTSAANIAAANVNIRTLDANLGNVSISLISTNANVADVAAGLTAANLRITSITSIANTNGNNIVVLQGNVTTLNANVSELNINAAAQASQITTINANVTGANAQIRRLDANLGTVSDNFTNLFANTVAQEGKINSINANVTAANIVIRTLDANIGTLSSTSGGSSANILTLQNSVKSIDANVGGLSINAAIQGSQIVSIYSIVVNHEANLTTGPINVTGNITGGNVIAGKFYFADGTQIISSNNSISVGNIRFSGDSITNTDNNDAGITINAYGNGEIHLSNYTGIKNVNPGYVLHIGDQTDTAFNSGNIGINFTNGSSSSGEVVFDWDWWDGAVGTNDTGIVHANIGLYKQGLYNDPLMVFDYETGNVTVGNIITDKITSGDITSGNIASGNITSINIASGNITSINIASGNISSGNIYTDNYFWSNGVSSSYSNVEVSSYLSTGTVDVNVGNIYTQSVQVGAPLLIDANLAMSAIGNTNGYYSVYLQNLSSGNKAASHFFAAADDFNGLPSGNFMAMGINGGNHSDPLFPFAFPHDAYVYATGGNLYIYSDTGNTIVGDNTANISFFQDGNVTIFGNIVTTGTNSFFSGNVILGEKLSFTPQFAAIAIGSNSDNFTQVIAQNINSGTAASTDFVATADNGDDTNTFIDMGINSSTYSQPEYELSGPNDGYVYVSGNTTTGGGNLLLATTSANDIIFAVNGQNFNNEVMRITSANTVAVTGNLFMGGRLATTYTSSAPSSSVGSNGDLKGMIYSTGDYAYICYADYDGISNIWANIATVGTTW